MRKLLLLLPVAALAFAGFSCKEDEQPADPFDVVSDDRTPTAFTLDGQVGRSAISVNKEDLSAGSVALTLEVRDVDLTSVNVDDIRLPYGATSSVERGSKLDLSSGSATFTVTSESGGTRTFTVTYKEPARLEGKSILAFDIAGRFAYDAVIADDPDDETKGAITLYMDTARDNATAEITKLVLSDGASASVEAGESLTFANHSAAIAVTADNGRTKTYTVTYTPRIDTGDPIEGRFTMYVRDTKEGWGTNYRNAIIVETQNTTYVDGDGNNQCFGGDWYNICDKRWKWNEAILNLTWEYALHFITTSKDDAAGTISGIVSHTSPNGWFDFIWQDDKESARDILLLVPEGINTWTKNTATGEISFYVDGSPFGTTAIYGPSDPATPGNARFTSDGGKVLTIGKFGTIANEGASTAENVYALRTFRNLDSFVSWDKSIYFHSVKSVVWMLQKVAD